MRRRSRIAAATFALAACIAPEATAQTKWTSADGGLHFTPPAGWVRHDLPKADELVFAVSKGERGSGSPALSCNLKIKLIGPAAQPGFTQSMMNARLQAGAGGFTVDEKRVATAGGITFIDGFLAMSPRILIILRAFYVRDGNVYDADMKCGSKNPGELTMDDLATARQLFDTISVTP
jgi:hypothetical protein